MRWPVLAVAVVAFAAGLAGLLWLAAHFIAPPLFGALWRGTPSPWTAQMLAALPALLVGLPFGLAFGALPWRRTATLAFATALLAAAADLATVMQAGIDPRSILGRPYAIADVLFVAVFVGGALVARRATRHQSFARRGWLGAWAWLALATAFCAAAAWSWARVMPHGIQ